MPPEHRRRGLLAGGAALLLGGAARATAPRRLVCAGGALTEMVFRLGAGPRLVGVDSTSLHPPAARALPQIGYSRNLSAEGLLALRPDLLLLTAEAGPPAALAQLRAAGVAQWQARAGFGFATLRENLLGLAGALDAVPAGAALDAELAAAEQALAAAREAARRPAPRLLFLLAHAAGQVQFAGAGTAAQALIELAGARNAVEGVQGYRPLSAEAAVAAAPEVLLLTRQGLDAVGGTAGLLRLPGLGLTPAGRQGRVLAEDALLLLGQGPRLPEAVRWLGRHLGTLA